MQCDGVPARSLVFCEILQGVATISGDIVNKRDFTRCAEADGFRIAPTVVRLPRMAASGRLVPTKHLTAGGPALRPMHRSGGMAGVALTVKARPGDNLMLHAAIDRAVPGDVIVCGTPTGAGARFDPPIWLKPGDVIEVEAEGIGILRNTVRDEA